MYNKEDLKCNIFPCIIQGKFDFEIFDGFISIVITNDSLNSVTQDLINNIKQFVTSNTVSYEY